MSVEEFYARPAVPAGPAAAAAGPAAAAAAPRAPSARPAVVAGLLVLALLAGLGYALWPHSSDPARPDPATARLFGQQTRAQLPQPVTADDCAAAVHAFAAIARDATARAAFVDGCVHAG